MPPPSVQPNVSSSQLEAPTLSRLISLRVEDRPAPMVVEAVESNRPVDVENHPNLSHIPATGLVPHQHLAPTSHESGDEKLSKIVLVPCKLFPRDTIDRRRKYVFEEPPKVPPKKPPKRPPEQPPDNVNRVPREKRFRARPSIRKCYICDTCGERFYHLLAIKLHIDVHVKKTAELTCKFWPLGRCSDVVYSDTSACNLHMLRHHFKFDNEMALSYGTLTMSCTDMGKCECGFYGSAKTWLLHHVLTLENPCPLTKPAARTVWAPTITTINDTNKPLLNISNPRYPPYPHTNEAALRTIQDWNPPLPIQLITQQRYQEAPAPIQSQSYNQQLPSLHLLTPPRDEQEPSSPELSTTLPHDQETPLAVPYHQPQPKDKSEKEKASFPPTQRKPVVCQFAVLGKCHPKTKDYTRMNQYHMVNHHFAFDDPAVINARLNIKMRQPGTCECGYHDDAGLWLDYHVLPPVASCPLVTAAVDPQAPTLGNCTVCGRWCEDGLQHHVKSHRDDWHIECKFRTLGKCGLFAEETNAKVHMLTRHFLHDNLDKPWRAPLSQLYARSGRCECGYRGTGVAWLHDHVMALANPCPLTLVVPPPDRCSVCATKFHRHARNYVKSLQSVHANSLNCVFLASGNCPYQLKLRQLFTLYVSHLFRHHFKFDNGAVCPRTTFRSMLKQSGWCECGFDGLGEAWVYHHVLSRGNPCPLVATASNDEGQ